MNIFFLAINIFAISNHAIVIKYGILIVCILFFVTCLYYLYVQDCKKQMQKLEQKCYSLSVQSSKDNVIKENLRNDLFLARKDQVVINKQLDKARNDISVARQQAYVLSNDNVKLKADISNLNMELSRVKKLLDKSQKDLESSRIAENAATKKNEELETKLNEHASAIEDLEAKVSSQKYTILGHKSVYSKHVDKICALENVIQELTNKSERQESLLSEAYSTIEDQKSILEQNILRIEALENELSEGTEKLKQKEIEIDNGKSLIKEQAETITSLSNEINASESKISLLQMQIEEYQEQAGNMPDVSELKAELECTIASLQTANEDLNVCRRELSFNENLADSRGNEVKGLIAANDELKYKLDLITQERDELLEKLKKQNDEKEEEIDKGPISEEGSINTETVGQISDEEDETPSSDTELTSNESSQNSIDREEEGSSAIEEVGNEKIGTQDMTNAPKVTIYPVRRPKKEAPQESEDVDLPAIVNSSGIVNRSILAVYDKEIDEGELINADEFFQKTPEEIERISRYLEEADKTNRDAFVCACCGNRVKISKRESSHGEILFFTHCSHNITCDWKKEHYVTVHPKIALSEERENEIELEISKYRKLKDLIIDKLQSDVSCQKGVSDVEEDKVIKSKYNFMHWRRACICAKFRERNFVFELQTSRLLMNTLVDKDIFYRIHNMHVVWVFGADEGTGYDYIRKHAHQNTMFANKRNVFILDQEAIKACEERNELILKCNYLDADDQWHYRMETTGNNGVLISVDQLSYDDDLCKPFFFDANVEFFKINPQAKENYEHSILSREELINDLQLKFEGRKAELRKKKKENKAVVTQIVGVDNRYLYCFENKYGVIDRSHKFIIDRKYDEIKHWTENKYVVRELDLWSIIDENHNTILPFRFKRIGEINNDKALVNTGTEEYFVDSSGIRIQDETLNLPNGWIKYRNGTKWGIIDNDGNEIVKCEYDEISSFRNRLIGFINNSFQKLVPRYEYKMKLRCTCIDNTIGHTIYDINGVRLRDQERVHATLGTIYDEKCIVNIIYNSDNTHLYVSKLQPGKELRKFNPIDQDSDFILNTAYTGHIVRIKNNRQFYVEFANGKESYFTPTSFKKGTGKSSYTLGQEIILLKVGFDSNYDKTIWKVI